MTAEQIASAALIVMAILAVVAFGMAISVSVDEAQRKLGREMTCMEVTVACAFLMFVPYSFLVALAYVWLVMLDKSGAAQ